jgi:exodeoxyribonuclease VII large subunit
MRLNFEKIKSSRIFKEPFQKIKEQYINIDIQIKQLQNIINTKFNFLKSETIEKISKLDALSPLKTLTRGYCIAEHNNKVIKESKILKKDDIIKLKFQDGEKLTSVI